MLPILAIIALVSFIGVNVFISRQKQRRLRRHERPVPIVDPHTMAIVERVWIEVAEAHGMTVDPAGSLGMRGNVHGVPCELELELGEASEGIETVARAHRIPELTRRLEVVPRDWGHRLFGALGKKSVETGDATFDEAFLVWSDQANVTTKVLDDKTRDTLAALRARRPKLTDDGSTIELTLLGAEMVHENLEAIFALLTHVAGVAE